jgi:hypothetical protein
MKSSFVLVFAACMLAGCAATKQPVYAFDYSPPHRERWTRSYDEGRATHSLQGFLDDAESGARVTVYRDQFGSPTPADAAKIWRIVLERRGFAVGEEIDREEGRASFSIADPGHRIKGEVFALRAGDRHRHVVLVGTWPEETDGEARAGMRALVDNLHLRTVDE